MGKERIKILLIDLKELLGLDNSKMKLSIIILNFKKKELTLNCVKSIYLQYQKEFEKREFETVVVDNFSEDKSVEYLKKGIQTNKFKNVFLYQNSKNAGFGGGCNFGAKHAKGDYLLFLNNDTKVLDNGILGMIDFLNSRPTVGIIGGKMENENMTPQASTGRFYTFFNAILMIFSMQRLGLVYNSPKNITKTDWVSGSSLMIRKALFDKIGGFDEKIFMYMEDVELCFRAKKAGFSTYYYPFVKIIHAGQGSSNRTFAIINIYKGLIYFYKKHMPLWQTNMIELLLRLKAIVLISVGKLIHNNYLVSTYEEAISIFR